MKAAAEVHSSERRRSPRNSHVIEGWLSTRESQDRTEVTTFDISRHGVSFDAQFPLPIGSEYVYQIGFGTSALTCDIRVMSCLAIADGIWHIGADFR